MGPGFPRMELSPSVLHGLNCRACENFGYTCTSYPGLREASGPSGCYSNHQLLHRSPLFPGRLDGGRNGPEAFPEKVASSHIVRRKPVKAVEENDHILGS